jgi:tRNA-splicing ligase RtcB
MITEEQANASMGNVIFGRWNGDYSESPLAYKDIDEVMENQKDLVEIKYKLTPVAVLKGEGQKRRRKNKNMEVE